MPDPNLPTIDTSGLSDAQTKHALDQFNADLQAYFLDQAQTLGQLSSPPAYASVAQQPLVSSAFSQWTNQAYQPNICSALDGGTTWTVAQLFLTMNRYMVIGKTLFWHFGAAYFTDGGGTLTGAPLNLRVVLPADLIAIHNYTSPVMIAGDSNNLPVSAMGFTDGVFLTVSRQDGAAFTNNAGIAFMAVIELA